MSTNRLYIYDEESGERVLIATSMSKWSLKWGESLADFLEDHDIEAACTPGSKTRLRLCTEVDLPDETGGEEPTEKRGGA